MDADRLAEIKRRWDALPRSQARADFHELVAEVDRLQAADVVFRSLIRNAVIECERRAELQVYKHGTHAEGLAQAAYMFRKLLDDL